MKGKTINGYTLQYLLGMGGMAEVWYAENRIRKRAAVKVLLPRLCKDETVKARFLTEAKVMVSLTHPNIRQVYDLGEIDGRPAIVMEYLDGDDLKARMKRGQQFTEDDYERWWDQLVDALDYTHQKGVIHRDIKPGNIFVNKEGNIKLLDFGIAKVRDNVSSTQTGQRLGTLMYMSPEQVRDSKNIDYHTDLYSLAVTFVHLLSRQQPYDSDSSSDFEIGQKIVNQPLDMSALPEEWQRFLTPYLEKDPSKRPELRHFEKDALWETPAPIPDDDDATMLGGMEKPEPTPVEKPVAGTKQPVATPISSNNDASNTKGTSNKQIVVWIGLAAVAVALILLLVSPKTKKHSSDNSDLVLPTATTSQSASASSLTITANGVSFQMKLVEGGTFSMGSTESDAYADESPVHNVTVGSFYIGETEVTQALWKAVMGSEPSDGWSEGYGLGNTYPAYSIDWDACQQFIRKLNSLTGRSFRLPTEAEWEYAARGGKNSHGYKYAGSNTIGNVAWFTSNTNDHGARPVKTKQANELGLYDMSGNVWEWCQDWYDKNYYGSSSTYNPQGPSTGSSHVLRGGCWFIHERRCRVTNRGTYDVGSKVEYCGIRLVLPQ